MRTAKWRSFTIMSHREQRSEGSANVINKSSSGKSSHNDSNTSRSFSSRGKSSKKVQWSVLKMLKVLKKKSSVRRRKLALELGVSSPDDLSQALCGRRELDEIRRLQYKINPSKHRYSYESSRHSRSDRDRRRDSHKRSKEDDEVADIFRTEDKDTYKGSNVFLKGTQSANPHNDYAQHFVDTGQRAQNFIRDVSKEDRFKEYPKLQELIRLKDEQIKRRATQPMYLKCDLSTFDLSSLGTKFDVIHLTPPLEEYQRRASGVTFSWTPWDWEDIMNLKIEDVAAQRSFVFIWCGSGEGLDLGRECLKKWGFRRCEDICWVKTNTKNPGKNQHQLLGIFQNTKEHCLMGIKGTVRRNQDGHFIHANIDLDIVITEEPELGNIEKPDEIYDIMEHFCLGRRRLHLFGNDSTIRPGWLTVGPELTSTNFARDKYLSFFEGTEGHLLGHSDEIESMRPKTPPLKRGGGRGSPMIGRGGVAGGRGRGTPPMSRGGMHSGGRTF